MSLLRRLAPALPDLEIGEISHQLGDLPLGIAQAASVLAETGMSGEEYLRELNLHAADLLDEGVPVPYSRSLAAVVRVSMNRLGQEEEAAVQLMQICAMLAPEPVPLELFTTAPKGILPEPLAAAGTSNLAMRRLVGRLARYGLARVSGEGPHLHRLTQAIVVDTLTPHERLDVHSHARRLLSAMNPADSTNPALWPRWSRLLSHWLAVNSINIGGADLQSLASEAALQLLTQGESPAAQRLAAMLYQVWRIQLGGDDHPDVLCVARSLAHAYRALGRYVQAQTWDEDTLARSRRVLGNDHPDTLASAAALATDLRALRRYEQARALDEETLARSRRTIGLDQPDSIAAACNVAADYRELGRFDEAYSLDNRTLAQSRSALGDHHPHTLTLVANLATDALHIERPLIALELYQEALNGMRQTLGLSHPDTLNTADALALCMDRLGNVEEARDLDHETLRALQRPADDKRPLPAAIGEVAINLYRLGLVRQAAPLNRSTIGRDQQINGQHKETLMSASYLAVELHRLRRIDDMRQLEVEVLRRCVGWRE